MKNISIKNIYWMLAYAFRSLNEKNISKINAEQFENIYDLFIVMITQELSKQIKRGINKEYILVNEELSNLKGKLLINESLKRNSLIKNKMICEYDEYSVNSYLNRIIKTTCIYLIKSNKVSDKQKIIKLKKLLVFLDDVDTLDLNSIQWNNIKYNKNNASYRLLVNLCYLILDGLIITKEDGKLEFKNYIDEQKIHKLYEKFILEYYKYHHKELNASVPQIKWNIDSDNFIEFLPKMQTDIVLKFQNKTLIIDAKYYSNIFQNNPLYDKNSFHSHNLYQIYTYVKNEDKNKTGNVEGLLLYAKSDKNDNIEAQYNMDGNIISVSNIDLSKDFNCVKEKLESIAKKII